MATVADRIAQTVVAARLDAKVEPMFHPDSYGAFALLVAAGTGMVLGTRVPRRWGRPGGAFLVGGLSVLLARDVTMIAAGSLQHLRVLPWVMLVAETMAATAAVSVGVRSWLAERRPDGGPPVSVAARTENVLATVTFGIHTARQAIYLSPGQGQRLKESGA